MSNISIRSLAADDFEAFVTLRRLGFATDPTSFWNTTEEEAPFVKDKFLTRITKGNNFTLGAFSGDRLVGIMAFTGYDLSKLRHKGDIHGVYVHTDFRGQGIASALLKDTLERGFDIKGVEKICLAVTAINSAAKTLYEKHGFVEYGFEQDGMRVDGVAYDQYWMHLTKENYQL